MKISIIKHVDKGNVEIYTLKTRNGLMFDIIVSHEHHETMIFDYQNESIISEMYGVYVDMALKELKGFLALWA